MFRIAHYSLFGVIYCFTGCWAKDPHKRPTFKEILRELEKIDQSRFAQTPNESFHTMQDGWKKEIAEVLNELRIKEKVTLADWPIERENLRFIRSNLDIVV